MSDNVFQYLLNVWNMFFPVCLGSSGDVDTSLSLAEETPGLVRRTNNPLERFLLRRANKMIRDSPDQDYCLLLAYELLYLWNALGACLKHSHASIQIGISNLKIIFNSNTVKLSYNKVLGTSQMCLLWPGFMVVYVLNIDLGPKKWKIFIRLN
jgi:hypothetical protein